MGGWQELAPLQVRAPRTARLLLQLHAASGRAGWCRCCGRRQPQALPRAASRRKRHLLCPLCRLAVALPLPTAAGGARQPGGRCGGRLPVCVWRRQAQRAVQCCGVVSLCLQCGSCLNPCLHCQASKREPRRPVTAWPAPCACALQARHSPYPHHRPPAPPLPPHPAGTTQLPTAGCPARRCSASALRWEARPWTAPCMRCAARLCCGLLCMQLARAASCPHLHLAAGSSARPAPCSIAHDPPAAAPGPSCAGGRLRRQRVPRLCRAPGPAHRPVSRAEGLLC